MKRRSFLQASVITLSGLAVPSFLLKSSRLATDQKYFSREPSLAYLSKMASFENLASYLAQKEINFKVVSSLNGPVHESLLLAVLNRSYGRFGNFNLSEQNFNNIYVVTQGVDGKKLKEKTCLNVVSHHSEQIAKKGHLTDALPHVLNLRCEKNMRGYTSYWIDTSTRASVGIFLKFENNLKLPALHGAKLNDLVKNVQIEFDSFEKESLAQITKKYATYDFSVIEENFKKILLFKS